jgi:hypothetical protein
MSDWPGLDRFLATDPRDAGCEEALEILHVYVEPGQWISDLAAAHRTFAERLADRAKPDRAFPGA